AVTFLNCKNLGVSDLKIENSQQIHVSFKKCINVKAWNLKVVAPEKSPNTDGIHVTETQYIKIISSAIKT
ncbi:galacturonan 1,4-alpha-galacturonidase, partial [Sarracenia purpurea var. burkii]